MDATLEHTISGRRRRIAAALAFSLVAGLLSVLAPARAALPAPSRGRAGEPAAPDDRRG